MLRPFATRPFSDRGGVLDVRVLAGGEIAVHGREGVAILNRAFETLARIERGAAERTSRLWPLEDGRFLAGDPRFGELYVGERGGAFAKVELLDKAKRLPFGKTRYWTSVVPTQFGFVATCTDGVLVAKGSELTFHEDLANHAMHGAICFGGGAIVAGHQGYTIIDEHGAIGERHERSIGKLPVALGTRLFWPEGETTFVPFLDGVLHCTSSEISFRRDEEAIWTFARPEMLQAPSVVGERVVVGAYDSKEAWILDRNGALVATIDLGGTFDTACAFADGIALESESDSIAWWRPDAELARLTHDRSPHATTTFEADGLLSVDGSILYRWSATENGPEAPPIETKIPFDVPIVVAGSLLTITERGRYALRGRNAYGAPVSLEPDTKFRPATSPEEAKTVLGLLLARKREGDLPALDWKAQTQDLAAALRDLTPKETVNLQTRALFAPGKLDRNARWAASFARRGFYEELASALGVSPRVLSAAVRAGQFPLEPPKKIEGFEYIGAFTTSTGNLVVADPCYIHRSKSAFPLSFHVEGREGRWHAFLRPDANDPERTAEIVVVHERGFDAYAADPLGVIGVDGGQGGVFDRSIPKAKDDEPPIEEGIVSGLGAVASSGHGDGMYPAFTGSIAGKVVKIRIHFLGPSPEIDPTIAKTETAAADARAYAATEKFSIGERLVHKKFGVGTVVRDLPGGKIEVLFDEGPRTLVHGLKT